MLRNVVLAVAAALATIAVAPATASATTDPLVEIHWQSGGPRGTQVTIRGDGSVHLRGWTGMGFWAPWVAMPGVVADPDRGVTADGQSGIVRAPGPKVVVGVVDKYGTPWCQVIFPINEWTRC